MAPIKEFSSADLNTISRLSGVSNVLVKVNGATVAASSFSGLLDTYTGAAAAYSVRKLDKDYTGSCMRIVVDSAATVGTLDSSDPEFDIGFDTNGDLDTAEIVTRCNNPSGNNYNAYVTKWYDQSGNGNDATQDQYTAMPQIYNGSAVHTVNGKPAFDTISGAYLTSGALSGSGSDTLVFVTSLDASTFMFSGQSTSYEMLIAQSGQAYAQINQGSGTPSFYFDGSSSATSLSSRGDVYSAFTSQRVCTTFADLSAWTEINLGYFHGAGSFPMSMFQELIFWDSTQSSTNRSGIEGNVNAHFQIGNFGTPTSGLLSTYTGAAAAYSVRQLANTAALCMRVRRDNDDAEQDFGFDANGDLDTSAIATFVGSGNNGYVSKWYDQSGNQNDAAQTTNGDQPQIYNGSAVITENGKPAVDFTRTSGRIGPFMSTSSYIVEMSQNDATVFTVYKKDAGNYVLTEGDSISPVSSQFIMPFSNSVVWVNSTTIGAVTLGQQLNSWVYNGSTVAAYVDGSVSGTATSVTVNAEVRNKTFIGTRSDTEDKFDGRIQEIITYKSAQSSTNRSGIETDINDYFSIY